MSGVQNVGVLDLPPTLRSEHYVNISCKWGIPLCISELLVVLISPVVAYYSDVVVKNIAFPSDMALHPHGIFCDHCSSLSSSCSWYQTLWFLHGFANGWNWLRWSLPISICWSSWGQLHWLSENLRGFRVAALMLSPLWPLNASLPR